MAIRSVVLSASFCAVALGACQTVETGRERTVEFLSEPAGANVITTEGRGCTTPCALEIGSKRDFTATFTLEGYKRASVDVKSKVTDKGVAIVAASTVLGGVGALAGASMAGDSLFHEPNPVSVVLERIAVGKAAPKGRKAKVAPAPKTQPAAATEEPAEAPAE